MTDLGPADIEHTSSALATFKFAVPGSFRLCYKGVGQPYTHVGDELFMVEPSHRQIAQSVAGLVTDCTLWVSTLKAAYQLGYALSVNMSLGNTYHPGHFLRSRCSASRRGSPAVTLT